MTSFYQLPPDEQRKIYEELQDAMYDNLRIFYEAQLASLQAARPFVEQRILGAQNIPSGPPLPVMPNAIQTQPVPQPVQKENPSPAPEEEPQKEPELGDKDALEKASNEALQQTIAEMEAGMNSLPPDMFKTY